MAGGSRRFKLDIPPDVSDVIRRLPPDVKQAALKLATLIVKKKGIQS